MELAKTKVQFYEKLENAFPSPACKANSVQHIACEGNSWDITTE